MSIGILGQKVGTTQIYMDNGKVVPVTVIQAGPCSVLQLKSTGRDGYEAVQLGYKDMPRRLAAKSQRGHVAKLESKRQRKLNAAGIESVPKAGCEPKKFIREFRVPVEGYTVGQVISVDVFENVLSVDVTAVSKGCGYSGVMKRHNFAGQRATHGVKKCHRHLGSSGCSAFPSRTPKGKRMPGQYGNDKITIRNQKVVYVDKENNLLLIRGAVPGPNGGFVTINPTNYLPSPKANPWKFEKKES
ncbi:MAG: 50S ribosomal protein L3 [Planctomycetaceae bacterium]|nr:50S ribosomal protein L3 [Planctomycetaceae bacterium]